MTRRTPKHKAAGKPAVILPGIVTELDRAIVARREAGETRKAICEALGVNVSTIQRAEWRCRDDAMARAMLAECPDSIEGLNFMGELVGDAADAFRRHQYRYEGDKIERMSEVAALGRHYVSRMNGIGPKSLASIDRALDLLGIAWSPVDRTPQPKSQVQQQEAEQRPAMSDGSAWSSIVRRVGEIEQIMGTGVFETGVFERGVFESDARRDSIDYVSMRLSFLTGYLDGYVNERRRVHKPMRDITPEPDSSEDLETTGNLVCLPGVRLVDVLPQNHGGRP
jgi:hypothetical protein